MWQLGFFFLSKYFKLHLAVETFTFPAESIQLKEREGVIQKRSGGPKGVFQADPPSFGHCLQLPFHGPSHEQDLPAQTRLTQTALGPKLHTQPFASTSQPRRISCSGVTLPFKEPPWIRAQLYTSSL